MIEDASATIDDFADSIGTKRDEDTGASIEDLAVSIGAMTELEMPGSMLETSAAADD